MFSYIMTLTSFNIIELSTFCVSVLGGVAMLLAQTQKSKCKNLRCCWGCVVCDRAVDTVQAEAVEEEEEEDLESGKVDVERKEELNKNKIPIPKVELPKVNIVVKK